MHQPHEALLLHTQITNDYVQEEVNYLFSALQTTQNVRRYYYLHRLQVASKPTEQEINHSQVC